MDTIVYYISPIRTAKIERKTGAKMTDLDKLIHGRSVLDEAFRLLSPLFEVWGEDEVINLIHAHYHNKGK